MKRIFIFLLYISINSKSYSQNSNLNYFIHAGLQNSPLLKDYQNQQILNKYDSLLLRATLKPQVVATSINSFAPVIKGWGYDAAITNERTISALVSVNLLLPNKNNLATQFKSISLQNEAIGNTSKISEQDLIRTIISQYIITYNSLMQLHLLNEVNNLLLNEEIILKKLTQSNVYKQVDYLAFMVTRQQQEFQIKQQKIQYQDELSSLYQLCGIEIKQNEDEIQSPNIQLYEIEARKSSIFFRQFDLDSLKILISKDLLNVMYRPKVNLFADAGYNSSIAFNAYKNFGTSFGIGLSMPISDGKQKQLQISKLDIAQQTNSQYKIFYINQYQQRIAQLKQQLLATEKLIDDINGQLKYAQNLIDAIGKLLEAGEVRVTDYIVAMNSYINIKNLLTQNEINRYQIINQLNYWNK